MQELHSTSRTKDSFVFKFEGDSSINSALLGRTLIEMTTLINTLSKSLDTKPASKLMVQTFRTGSFEVIYELVCDVVDKVFTPESLNTAAVLINTLKGCFEIKRLLKDQKPKEVKHEKGNIIVTAHDGSNVIVTEHATIYMTDPHVDKSISMIAQTSSACNPNNGFALIESNGTVTSFPSADVKDMSTPLPPEAYKDQTFIREEQVSLPIVKVVFAGDSPWSFKYGSRSINAKIEDQHFLTDYRNRSIDCRPGDKLFVDLRITTKKTGMGEVISERYAILRVYNVVHPQDQDKHEQLRFDL